jgi:uncharacterized membrane protein
MDTTRLEAFSDGVFAMAITLLVLDLHVPLGVRGHLLAALAHQWPSYASYVISFFVIGIIWVNHHAMFHHIVRVDRPILFLNLLLLLFVAVIPFTTAVLAEYIRSQNDSAAAGVMYSGVMILISVSFTGMWVWAAADRRLLHPRVEYPAARSAIRRSSVGMIVYTIALALALMNAAVMLAFHFAIDSITSLNRSLLHRCARSRSHTARQHLAGRAPKWDQTRSPSDCRLERPRTRGQPVSLGSRGNENVRPS